MKVLNRIILSLMINSIAWAPQSKPLITKQSLSSKSSLLHQKIFYVNNITNKSKLKFIRLFSHPLFINKVIGPFLIKKVTIQNIRSSGVKAMGWDIKQSIYKITILTTSNALITLYAKVPERDHNLDNFSKEIQYTAMAYKKGSIAPDNFEVEGILYLIEKEPTFSLSDLRNRTLEKEIDSFIQFQKQILFQIGFLVGKTHHWLQLKHGDLVLRHIRISHQGKVSFIDFGESAFFNTPLAATNEWNWLKNQLKTWHSWIGLDWYGKNFLPYSDYLYLLETGYHAATFDQSV